mgnify:CR=1 FL=1
MRLKQLLSTLFLLNLTFGSFADAFDELEAETYERGNATKTHTEMDDEFGGCMRERQENKQRVGKMLDTLKSKKNKIAKLEAKIDSLKAKLNKPQKPKICDTSELTRQIEKLQARNTKLKSKNGRLTDDMYALKNAQAKASGSAQTALLNAQQEIQQLNEYIDKLRSERTEISHTQQVVPNPLRPVVNKLPRIDDSIDIVETVDASWSTSAGNFKRRLDQDFAFNCPSRGAIGKVFGGNQNKYNVGSSVCTAAVHAGLITAKSGGSAVIRIITNKSGYKGSYKNSVQGRNSNNKQGFIFLR